MSLDLDRERWEHARRELLVAARKVFARRGVHNTSISQLATALGVGRSSLYYYFNSKEELVEEALQLLIQEYHPDFSSIAESLSTREALRVVFDRQARRLEAMGREDLRFFYRAMLEEGEEPEVLRPYAAEVRVFHDGLQEILRRGQKRKEIRADIEVEEAILELLAGMIGNEFLWLMDPSIPFSSWNEKILDRWLSGLAIPAS